MLAIALRACPVDVVPGPIKAKEVKAPVTIVGEVGIALFKLINHLRRASLFALSAYTRPEVRWVCIRAILANRLGASSVSC